MCRLAKSVESARVRVAGIDKWRARAPMNKYKVISLFSGAMGLDIGIDEDRQVRNPGLHRERTFLL